MASWLTASSSWAAIAVRGSATSAISTSASVTVSRPTGVVAGDILIANISNYLSGTQTTASSSGWTVIAGTDIDRGRATLLYKVATGTEPSSYTFSVTAASSAATGVIIAFSGVSTANPFDVTNAASWYTATSTSISNVPAITTVTPGAAVILFGNCSRITSTLSANFSNWSVTAPSPLTELYDVGHNAINNSCAVGAAWGLLATPGATGLGGLRCDPNTNPRIMGGYMLALRPCVFASAGSSLSAICQGGTSAALGGSVGGTATGGTWSDGGVGGSFTPNSTTLNATYTPPSSFTGTVTLTLTSSGGSCGIETSSKTLAVNPIPTSVTASASASTVCSGAPINLTSSATSNSASSVTLINENFNAATNNWTTTNTSTGGTTANAAWKLRPSGYNSGTTGAENIITPDASQFYFSSSDEQGSGGSTNTTLVSPAVSTLGLSSATIALSHYYRDYSTNDFAYVEASTNGTSWTTLATYSSSQGSANAFQSATISLTSGFLNQSTVYIRFRYVAAYDWYWAINSVSLSGVYSSTAATFSWASSPAGYTSTSQNPTGVSPTVNTSYTVTATNNYGCTAQASTSTVTVNARPTVSFTAQPGAAACYNTDVTYTTQAGQSTYVWTVPGVLGTDYSISSGGIGSTDNTVTLKWLTSGSKTVSVNYNASNGCSATSATSSTTTVTLQTTASVAITSSDADNTICSGSSVTFTAAPTNGGGSPTYQWKLNGSNVGTSSTTYTTTALASGDVVNVVMNSNATCVLGSPATSNSITTTVNPLPSVPTGTSAARCGTGTVALSASVGAGETVDWYSVASGGTVLSGGTGTTTFTTPSISATTSYYAQARNITTGCVSSTRATVTATFNARPTVTFTTQPGASACANTDVTYTTQSGQSNYVWTVPGVLNTDYSITSGGVGSTDNTVTLKWLTAGSKTVSVNYDNANGCSASTATNSTATTVTLQTTASVSILANDVDNTICAGTSVTFTATPVNGGTPSYQWVLNGTNVGTNSPTYTTTTLTNNSVISVIMTSNKLCVVGSPATSNSITTTVNPLPTAVTVSGGGTVCDQAYLTASGGVGGTIYYQGTVAGGISTATPSMAETLAVNGTYYFNAITTAGCWGTQGSATVNVVITPTSQGVSICPGASGQLSATSVCADITGLTSGPREVGTGSNLTGVGTVAWTNTGNVTTAGSPYAGGMSVGTGATTNYLRAINYGFSIPSQAVINGITLVINRSSSGTSSPYIRDSRVSLVKAGVVQTTNKAITGVDWSNNNVLATATYGGPNDLWGTTWTAADINNSTFGAVLSAVNGSTANNRTPNVDYMRITVTYTIPGVMNWFTASSGGSSIGSGTSFNPVGVTGSGLVNTNTPGTTTYYMECSNIPGCRRATDFTVLTPPSATSTAGNIACKGGTTTVTVTGSNGASPYSGEGTFTVSAGSYSYTVTDANSCTATTSGTITEPSVVTASASIISPALCHGGTSDVSVSASGGIPPYTGTGTFTVSAGTYSYTVTDANGCTASTSIAVTHPALLSATATGTNITCFGGTSAVTVSASGGTTPYVGTGTFTESAGSYTYTVTDVNGCSATASISLSEPASALTASATEGSITCNGGTTTVTVTASGGTSGYTGTGNFTRSAGAYSFTVTDANGCTAVASGVLTEPTAVSVNATTSTPVLCNGGTGQVTVSASGGTGSYSGDGSFTVSSGNYSYTVTDANGCTGTASVSVTQPSAVSATATNSTQETCPQAADGSVLVGATGGTSPYTGTGSQTGLTAGSYTFTVTDANGCTATASASVSTTQTASVAATAINSSALAGCVGSSVTLTLSGGSLGTGGQWVWYKGACGSGSPIGTGTSVTVNENTAGTVQYFVRAQGTCNTTACTQKSFVWDAIPSGTITILSASDAGCIGGTGTITASTVAGAAGYTWTSPAGGVLFNGQPGPYVSTTPSVSLTFTAAPSGGSSGWNVCVNSFSGCGTSPNTKCIWIRYSVSTPGSITGIAGGCPGVTQTYSVPAVQGASGYRWSITGAAEFSNGLQTITTTQPTTDVEFLTGFAGSTLSVSALTSCGSAGGARTLLLNAAPPLPGAINGATYICPGSNSNAYSIAPVASAGTYQWTASGTGLSIVGSGLSANVTTTTSFVTGTICVTATNGCGVASAIRCKNLSTGKIGTPGNISGDPLTGVCGQVYTYSIPAMPNASAGYTWTLPAGATAIGSVNSNTITLSFSNTFTAGQLCVRGNSGCGGGFDRCATLTGAPAPPGVISGPTGVCAGATEIYTWAPVPGATAYQIVVPAGATVLTGGLSSSSTAIIAWGSTGGNLVVKAQNDCGISGSRSLAVSIACRLSGPATSSFNARIYPNPTSERINVDFDVDNEELLDIRMTDVSGRVVIQQHAVTNIGENHHEVDLSSLKPGAYWISLSGNKSGKIVKTVIIE